MNIDKEEKAIIGNVLTKRLYLDLSQTRLLSARVETGVRRDDEADWEAKTTPVRGA